MLSIGSAVAVVEEVYDGTLGEGGLFAPDEVAIVHVMNPVVRRCFLLDGLDSQTSQEP